MKRLLILFLILTGAAMAQVPGAYTPQLITYPGVPTGTCQIYQFAVNVSNGALYNCLLTGGAPTGSWQASGGAGGLSFVASLPATCTPGTTQSVQLSVAPFTAYYCSSTNTWTQIGTDLGSPVLPDTAHLIVQNLMLDGSGNATDSSPVGTNICTLAAAGQAPTWNTAASGGGLNFLGTSSQYCSYPAAVNAARTIIIATQFQPGTYAPAINNFAVDVQLISGSAAAASSAGWGLVSFLNSSAYHAASQGSFSMVSVNTSGGLNYSNVTACNFQGVGVIAWTLGATDAFYINGQPCVFYAVGGATGSQQSSGVFQLGGSATQTPSLFYTGTIYAVAMWSTVLTPAQVGQATQSLQSTLTQRGIQQYLGGNLSGTFNAVNLSDISDQLVLEGDSLFSGTNIPASGLSGKPWYTADLAIPGSGSYQVLNRLALDDIPLYRPGGNRNVFVNWSGTNSCGSVPSAPTANANLSSIARIMKAANFKTITATMIDRSGTFGACHDALNPLIRQYGPLYNDGIMDIAANVHLGCDGCNANSTYFTDGIHLTNLASQIVGYYYVHAVNRSVGNLTPSSNFNTYTGTGFSIPYATENDIDCGPLSGASVTCTFPFNNAAGSMLFANVSCQSCTGATFNVPTDGRGNTWNAITATNNYFGSNFHRGYYALNANAGANTVTFTFTGGTPASIYISLQEVTGVLTAAALDVNSALASGTNALPTAASITTTVAGDYVIGYGATSEVVGTSIVGWATNVGTYWTGTSPYQLINNSIPAGIVSTVSGSAGGYVVSAATPPITSGAAWSFGSAAFKPISGTSTYNLQDVDVYAECSPNGTNNVGLNLPDGAWMIGGTITIKNIQTAGAATCVVNAPTPYQQGVQQTIDGATSVTIANKATAVFKSKYSFTGTAGTNLVPVVTWELLQNN